MTQNERVLFKILANEFWPGPITFVVRANTDKIVPIIRNNTPFVGLRAPDNITALALLRAAGVPIAAPSANRYTKISPTSAPHVYNDYNGLGIFMPILDERNSKENVGIESTIVMLQEKGGVVYVTILRSGAIGSKDLTDAFVGMCDIPYVVVAKSNDVNGSTSVAPGQERLHYSPANAETFRATVTTPATPTTTPLNYSKSVLIATDNVVGGHGRKYQKCFTLPSTAKDCASVLYNVMRKADAYCKESDTVNIVICTDGIHGEEGCGFMDAIEDKVARASAKKEAVEV
jgi:L-threonylcarbamoyladenylate synthase